jgi:hypothetical protein
MRGFKSAVISLMVFYFIFNIIFLNYLYPTLYRNNPLTKTIATVKQYDNVVAYKTFHPSFTFYLPKRVKVYDNPDSLNSFMEKSKALVISRQSLTAEIDSLQLQQVAAHHDLFENHTTVLLTNKK